MFSCKCVQMESCRCCGGTLLSQCSLMTWHSYNLLLYQVYYVTRLLQLINVPISYLISILMVVAHKLYVCVLFPLSPENRLKSFIIYISSFFLYSTRHMHIHYFSLCSALSSSVSDGITTFEWTHTSWYFCLLGKILTHKLVRVLFRSFSCFRRKVFWWLGSVWTRKGGKRVW